jgi:hypothetical protein
VPRLRPFNCAFRIHPVDREIVVGIRISRTRFFGLWTLTTVVVGIPGRRRDPIEILLQWLEGVIPKLFEET